MSRTLDHHLLRLEESLIGRTVCDQDLGKARLAQYFHHLHIESGGTWLAFPRVFLLDYLC